MIYLLLDSTDKKTIKSVSSGAFVDLPKEYIQVEIITSEDIPEITEETPDDEATRIGELKKRVVEVPEGFTEDCSLYIYSNGGITNA